MELLKLSVRQEELKEFIFCCMFGKGDKMPIVASHLLSE